MMIFEPVMLLRKRTFAGYAEWPLESVHRKRVLSATNDASVSVIEEAPPP